MRGSDGVGGHWLDDGAQTYCIGAWERAGSLPQYLSCGGVKGSPQAIAGHIWAACTWLLHWRGRLPAQQPGSSDDLLCFP